MKFLRLSLCSVVLFFLATPVFSQGNLTPPGPPAPTMKTLDQVEPRIDLQNAPTTAVDTTQPGAHFVILQPGSYYLSSNLSATKTDAILINAAGVTLDLRGFEISRASGTSGGEGVLIAASSHSATVCNGSIKGFSTGIASLSVFGDYPHGCRFHEVAISACVAGGLLAGSGAVISNCRVHDLNGGNAFSLTSGTTIRSCSVHQSSGSNGIVAGEGCVITDCSVDYGSFSVNAITADTGSTLTNCHIQSCTAGNGIVTGPGSVLLNCSVTDSVVTNGIKIGDGSVLTGCTARANSNSSAASAGIWAGIGCTVTACTAEANSTSNATPTGATGAGIIAGGNSKVQNCSASFNKGDGIRADNDCSIVANVCSNNGNAGDGAGVHATADDNRIEGNNVTSNDRGIDVDGAVGGNLIIRNSASGNTTNYRIASGNSLGAIVTAGTNINPISGSTNPGTLGTTDPWANISF